MYLRQLIKQRAKIMNNYHHYKVLLVICMFPLGLLAQEANIALEESFSQPSAASDINSPSMPSLSRHALEIYTNRHHLSAGYGAWSEAGLRGNYEIGANLLQFELASMRRFGESGTYLGIGDKVNISPDWFATLAVGAGDGASYLPRYRVDGFINRKLLSEKNLIGTLGLGYYRAPDGHIDRNLSLGGTYYFSQPWVVQAEVKFNMSNPGRVNTRQQFIAATWGRAKQMQITGRYAWGTEGYQSIGAGASIIDFRSQQASIALRKWINPHWGISGSAEHYKNPLYKRNGVNVGLFWQFQ